MQAPLVNPAHKCSGNDGSFADMSQYFFKNEIYSDIFKLRMDSIHQTLTMICYRNRWQQGEGDEQEEDRLSEEDRQA